MLAPEAKKQLRVWLEDTPYEVVVECIQTSKGIAWGQMLSTPGIGCMPSQSHVAKWSMHTHPRSCYSRNGTYYGWPSGADYAAFLDQRGTEHLVCSLEGIYVLKSTPLSLKKWAGLSERQKDVLEATWDIPSDSPDRTPAQALKMASAVLDGWVSVTFHPYS